MAEPSYGIRVYAALLNTTPRLAEVLLSSAADYKLSAVVEEIVQERLEAQNCSTKENTDADSRTR